MLNDQSNLFTLYVWFFFKGNINAPNYKHKSNVSCAGFSITKIESDKLDVIGIYRSQEGSVTDLIIQLKNLITDGKTTIIGGDFNNICE